MSVNGEELADHDVTSSILQWSVLGPVLFVIHINDMPECIDAPIYLFADDTKIYSEICKAGAKGLLQKDLDSLQKWSNTWLLKFHRPSAKS